MGIPGPREFRLLRCWTNPDETPPRGARLRAPRLRTIGIRHHGRRPRGRPPTTAEERQGDKASPHTSAAAWPSSDPVRASERYRTAGAMTPAVTDHVGEAFVMQEGSVTIEDDENQSQSSIGL
eukprot:3324284-Pyramimonas_sp.AAC.1